MATSSTDPAGAEQGREGLPEQGTPGTTAGGGTVNLPLVVGIAGTAKNTGKTTTTAAIMEKVYRDGVALGLTSIGYDGEEKDNVTGLPKPRVAVQPGTLVAIAARCVEAGTAKIDVLEDTGIHTPLGRVVIGRVTGKGLVVVAGPNKTVEVRQVVARLGAMGCRLVLVDGALNRIAPMAATDGLILATGASRTPDISRLAAETGAVWTLNNLETAAADGGPVWTGTERSFTGLQKGPSPETTAMGMVLTYGGGERVFPNGSLLTPVAARQVAAVIQEFAAAREGALRLLIPGIAELDSLRVLAEGTATVISRLVLVFDHPFKVLAAARPLDYAGFIADFTAAGGRIQVRSRTPLLAVTVNPFYPNYRHKIQDYQPAYVDERELKREVAAAVGCPVFNVLQGEKEDLWNVVKRHLPQG